MDQHHKIAASSAHRQDNIGLHFYGSRYLQTFTLPASQTNIVCSQTPGEAPGPVCAMRPQDSGGHPFQWWWIQLTTPCCVNTDVCWAVGGGGGVSNSKEPLLTRLHWGGESRVVWVVGWSSTTRQRPRGLLYSPRTWCFRCRATRGLDYPLTISQWEQRSAFICAVFFAQRTLIPQQPLL